MRLWPVGLVLMLALLSPSAQPVDAADAVGVGTMPTVLGAWTGHWVTHDARGRGAAEMVLSRVPGSEQLVAQFTFVAGAASRTGRYEGRVENARFTFALVGDGRLVLQAADGSDPADATEPRGEWSGARGLFPASSGLIQLTRAR